MNKTELRIGNMIRDIESGRIGPVLTLSAKKCTVKMEFSKLMQDYDEFEPIPLSEEWLLKCGFRHTGGGFYTHLPSLIQMCNISDQFFNVGFKDANIGRFYFVHQLQNLYFSLTGEELTIKN